MVDLAFSGDVYDGIALQPGLTAQTSTWRQRLEFFMVAGLYHRELCQMFLLGSEAKFRELAFTADNLTSATQSPPATD